MSSKWPHPTARAAICLTFDNMGEAADLNRNLWPANKPIGSHPSVTSVLPKFLALIKKHDVPATYFTESWNVDVYPDALKQLARSGVEVAWHAFQHEAWAQLSPDEERDNFERSFAAIRKLESDGVQKYKGFRPPGGIINAGTLALCKEFGVTYLSPAAEEAAVVPIPPPDSDRKEASQPVATDVSSLSAENSIVILPFKWATVDAFYYMDAFAGLRALKNEPAPEKCSTAKELASRYIAEVDGAIERGGFLSLLFHPFLTDSEERLEAMEEVVRYLVKMRDEGKVWLARCGEVDEWIRAHPGTVGGDPQWDTSSWR